MVELTTEQGGKRFASSTLLRKRSMLDEIDITETYSAQSAAAGTAGWDDPAIDAYDHYDAHRRKP
ncbi:MAG: hypothetical protein WEB58_23410 [Planctomycetaceae bacterium]